MVDAGTLEKVLAHIHNYFVKTVVSVSRCEISDGALPASLSDKLLDGQWYLIAGSYLNDGVHQYRTTYPQGQTSDLVDETFTGTVALLAIPRPLLAVVEEIGEWISDTREADRAARAAKFQSESFGGYTYSLKADSRARNASQGLTGWQAAFATDLNPWRKMS